MSVTEDMEFEDVTSAKRNDTSGSDSSDEEDRALQEKAKELENRIAQKPTDYNAYKELIDVYTELGALNPLRSVRERFAENFPLRPEIWLGWLADEAKLAESGDEKQKVIELFERALQDYLSVEIWVEYVKYCMRTMLTDNSLENVRAVLERATQACGSHVTEGMLIWDLYLHFENNVLISLKISASLEENNSSVPSDNLREVQRKIMEQKMRILDIYRRIFINPLQGMLEKWTEFETFIKIDDWNPDISEISAIFDKTNEKYIVLRPYEDALVSNRESKDQIVKMYQDYIEHELNTQNGLNDRMRIRCLFERAVTDLPLVPILWINYLDFLEAEFKIPEDILKVCYRASRNCSFSIDCWQRYLVFLEKFNKPREEINGVIERGLMSNFNRPEDLRDLWLLYIYYLRRQINTIPQDDTIDLARFVDDIRNVINRACDHLARVYGFDGDPECKMLRWWAKFEAEVAKDMDMYRKVWNDVMSQGLNTSADIWLDYIRMESMYGDVKKTRKLYAKALSLDTDSPEKIASSWIDFESHKGALESFDRCWRSVSRRLNQLKEKERKEAKLKKQRKLEQKAKKSQPKEEFKVPAVPPKKVDAKAKAKEKELLPPGVAAMPKKAKAIDDTAEAHGACVAHDATKDDRTVFVSNLAFDATEENIKTALSSAGTIQEIRLVKDYKGCSKGYGFVVFSSREEAQKALKMDRTPLDKRPMFISECDPDKTTRKTGIRFGTGLEKNKLFVKGLPLNFNQENIENLFKPYGALKDVRLVTYRNGYSKGIAYVEYEDEDSAAHALLKTDDMEIDGHRLHVALSNPPEKKNSYSLKNASADDFKKPSTSFEQKRRSKTQLFIPRAIKIHPSQSHHPEKMDAAESAPDTSKSKLTNEDFRKMLINNGN